MTARRRGDGRQSCIRKLRSDPWWYFPVGSALSLRIFRAAGALTGGIVSLSRLSAGEGTGGTEKFSSSLRTILAPAQNMRSAATLGTFKYVRRAEPNFLT